MIWIGLLFTLNQSRMIPKSCGPHVNSSGPCPVSCKYSLNRVLKSVGCFVIVSQIAICSSDLP